MINGSCLFSPVSNGNHKRKCTSIFYQLYWELGNDLPCWAPKIEEALGFRHLWYLLCPAAKGKPTLMLIVSVMLLAVQEQYWATTTLGFGFLWGCINSLQEFPGDQPNPTSSPYLIQRAIGELITAIHFKAGDLPPFPWHLPYALCCACCTWCQVRRSLVLSHKSGHQYWQLFFWAKRGQLITFQMAEL